MGRSGSLRASALGLPLPRAEPEGIRRRRADAGRGIHDAPGAAQRAHPLRWHQQETHGPPRRADRGDHLGRRDSRPGRLSRDPRADRNVRRYAERGLRDREHAGRHLPAGQHVLPDRQGRIGAGARGGRERPAADAAVLARRSAGPHQRAVGGGLQAAAGRGGPPGRSAGCDPVARHNDRHRRSRCPHDCRIPRRHAPDSRHDSDTAVPGARALLR